MTRPDDVATERFRDLMNEIGDALGRPRGWQTRIAKAIPMSPENLSRVLAGRNGVSFDMAIKVGVRLGIGDGYWRRGGPSLQAALGGKSVEEAVRRLLRQPQGPGSVGPLEALVTVPWEEVRAAARELLGAVSREEPLEGLARDFLHKVARSFEARQLATIVETVEDGGHLDPGNETMAVASATMVLGMGKTSPKGQR